MRNNKSTLPGLVDNPYLPMMKEPNFIRVQVKNRIKIESNNQSSFGEPIKGSR